MSRRNSDFSERDKNSIFSGFEIQTHGKKSPFCGRGNSRTCAKTSNKIVQGDIKSYMCTVEIRTGCKVSFLVLMGSLFPLFRQ